MPIPRQETGLSLSRVSLTQQEPESVSAGSADGAVLYHGNCHCGKNRFEVRLPETATITSCNCSLCHKSGYLWAFPGADDVKYTRGDESTLRTFETGVLKHEVRSIP